MRLSTRIRSLERRGATDGARGCPLCRGAGWQAVVVRNEPPGARPADWSIGCPSCGRIAHQTVVSIGPAPTLAEARAFMEAI